MTSQDIATKALRRWNELRQQGIDCRKRMEDPELQEYERQLNEVHREMAPVRQAIERTK